MPTLTALRRQLANGIGQHVAATYGAQVTPPSGGYAGTATGTQAKRRLVSTDLAEMNIEGDADEVGGRPSGRFGDWWAYILNATPEQRRVVRDSYASYDEASEHLSGVSDGTTPVGSVLLHRPLAAAPTAGTVFEMLSPLPAVDADGYRGLHGFINRALRALVTRSEVSLNAVSGQRRYSLSAYPWLTRESQLIQANDTDPTTPVSDPRPLAGASYLRTDNGVAWLILDGGLPSGSTFTISVWRPRSSRVKVNGVWTESTVGLVSETDEVEGSADHITLVARYFVADYLATRRVDHAESVAYWAAERARLAAIARPLMLPEEPNTPYVSPLRRGSGVSTSRIRRWP